MLFATLTRSDFYDNKKRYSITPYVQIHHILPRQFRNHPCLRDFEIDQGSNLMLMPNRAGKMHLKTTRPVHDGGHDAYNREIGKQLDSIYREVPAHEYEKHVSQLICNLRRRVRVGETKWN